MLGQRQFAPSSRKELGHRIGFEAGLMQLLEQKRGGGPFSLSLASAAAAFKNAVGNSLFVGVSPKVTRAWHLGGLALPSRPGVDAGAAMADEAAPKGKRSLWEEIFPIVMLPIAVLASLAVVALVIISAAAFFVSVSVGLLLLLTMGATAALTLVAAGLVGLFRLIADRVTNKWRNWRRSPDEKTAAIQQQTGSRRSDPLKGKRV